MSRILGTHIGLAFVALVTAGLLLGAGHLTALLSPQNSESNVLITLAYTKPLALSISVGRRGHGGVIEVSQIDGSETAHLSLPSTWQRTEVSGVPLQSAGSAALSSNWMSWELPPGSRLRFVVQDLPEHSTLSLPSRVPLSLTLTQANLADGTSTQETRLLKETTVALW